MFNKINDERLKNAITEVFSVYLSRGYQCYLVGGAVRDLLCGQIPKDFDFATNAPYEFTRDNFEKTIDTGIDHGTITIVVNDFVFEITRFRKEKNHNGRHCDIDFAQTIEEDLSRRDFTINSMAMTHTGELIDPFNGLDDLQKGLVSFVGDAETRIREDYLRILRWFRFRGRVGMSMSYSARKAIVNLAPGLQNISRERVWSEVRKILQGNDGPWLMAEMFQLGVAKWINLPAPPFFDEAHAVHQLTRNPVTMMVTLYGMEAEKILREWKASNNEINLAGWLVDAMFYRFSQNLMRLLAVDGASREWVLELAALREMDEFERGILACWEIPVFPVGGNDLLERGFKQDHNLGKTLKKLKEIWADSNFSLSKQELLDHLGGLL